jgi:hypothetical protein
MKYFAGNQYQRLLLVAGIVAGATVVGTANHALAQVITEFPVSTSAGLTSITSAADGAVWFIMAALACPLSGMGKLRPEPAKSDAPKSTAHAPSKPFTSPGSATASSSIARITCSRSKQAA